MLADTDATLGMFMEKIKALGVGRRYGTVDTSGAVELYNLKDDVREKRNVALENKDIRDTLLAELLAWHEQVQAPIPGQRRRAGGPNRR
jgi:hypothetical protein